MVYFSSLIPPQVKIWTLVTAPFFETSVVMVSGCDDLVGPSFVVLQLLVDLAILTAVGYVLEPLWNLRSYLVRLRVHAHVC